MYNANDMDVMKIITFAVTILLIATNAPYHLFGQSSVTFELQLNAKSDEIKLMDPLDLKVVLHNFNANPIEMVLFKDAEHQGFNAFVFKVGLKNKKILQAVLLFVQYPETKAMYESFITKFEESSFYPWIHLQLAKALIDQEYLKSINEDPDFEKCGEMVRVLFEEFSDVPDIKWQITTFNGQLHNDSKLWKYRNRKKD